MPSSTTKWRSKENWVSFPIISLELHRFLADSAATSHEFYSSLFRVFAKLAAMIIVIMNCWNSLKYDLPEARSGKSIQVGITPSKPRIQYDTSRCRITFAKKFLGVVVKPRITGHEALPLPPAEKDLCKRVQISKRNLEFQDVVPFISSDRIE